MQIQQKWLDRLSALCARYDLGTIKMLTQASRGINNRIFIVNNQYAIRFDGLTGIAESRFAAEKIAYDALTEIGVPVPRVIAVDSSHDFASGDVMIMTRVRGAAVIDTWHLLSAQQQRHLAYQFGQALAQMHAVTFEKFGRLRKLATNPQDRWIDYVISFYEQYMIPSLEQRLLPADLLERIPAIMTCYRPMLESVTTAHLVHMDAHPENVLQENGELTGIVDFEWALSGEPSSDFQVQDQWAEFCPDSLEVIYEGYLSLRSLPADHDQRVALYWLLRNLDSAVECLLDGDSGQGYQKAEQKMRQALAILES
ncbi:MAG: phosphotransferase [Anaerolineae bacterium]